MSATAPRVLVVDDEPQIVRGLKILLRSAGYTVDAAETKAQALVELVSRPPDALVLDLVLPDDDGRLQLDPRTLGDDELDAVIAAARSALGR